MTKQEFYEYIDNIGITTDFLDIHISETPDYPLCNFGCCKKDDVWIMFSNNQENSGINVYGTYSEDECFDKLKKMIPRLLSDRNIAGVYKNGAFEIKIGELEEYISANYGYTKEISASMCGKMKKHTAVLMEFKNYVRDKKFLPDDYSVKVSGINARKLFEEYNLSELGAFNYMVYMLEEPEEALKKLQKGLPVRKVINDPENIKEVNILEMENEQEQKLEQEQTAEPEQNHSNIDWNSLEEKLDKLTAMSEKLQQCFDDKIENDAHKNTLFDKMHSELVNYQNGICEKATIGMAMDIIQMLDGLKKNIKLYEKKERNEENYNKIFKILKGTAQDLEDILYRQSIEPYTVTGKTVDPKRQKIIQTVDTPNASLDNQVASKTAVGYEKDGKILRPERIKIYKYNPDAKVN